MSELEYGSWYYGYDPEKKHTVRTSGENEKPDTFFKYYALTELSVDALTHLYIYASHPVQLNDPMDCNNDFLKFDRVEDVKAFIGDSIYGELLKIYGNDCIGIDKFMKDSWQMLLYKKMGVLSLTTSNRNKLMWSLYANNNGFCIEFDCGKFGFETRGPFPIHYMDEMKELPLSKCKNGNIAALIQTTTKAKCWSFEDEWRLIVYPPTGFDMQHFGRDMERFNYPDDHNRKFQYPLSAIKSITLGAKFFDKALKYLLCDSELDVVYGDESFLECRVLSLLSNPKLSGWKRCLLTVEGCELCMIEITEIVKISNNHYRIISQR